MSGKYAKGTRVGSDRSCIEIERTLSRYGATSFMYAMMPDKAMSRESWRRLS